ncbi:DUF192 domain-containing protein [uncultured Methanobrevibacter sp.]|uniref:DUF192 domain-containing protein n=1 Tax=uncultured Methanobrevibacter sp. TaxID=253161 RepID=UPI0025EA249F|nr:DUF192 domain-containing protein [uncultured Methanobrevibacter sp.]MCI6993277.1 DUF192 domain-containing protein [Methanobrevibacter sp.]
MKYKNIKIILANTFYKRFKGLMLKKDFKDGLLFTNLTDSSIHTLFMRFEIDIYFLDENRTIFEKTSLKPWKFYKPKKQAKFILETKKDKLKLEIGDNLDFI